MKILFIPIILLAICSAAAQVNDAETLKQINQKLTVSFQAGEHDNSLGLARQAMDLTLKIYGDENVKTAVAYTNLGLVFRELKKYKQSIDNLQKAADIYQKIPGLKNKASVTLYESLAYSQLLDDKQTEAGASYLKALETAETQFGKDSKESLSPALNRANLHARLKEYEKADEFYLKSYAVVLKNFKVYGAEYHRIEDFRFCSDVAKNIGAEKNKSFEEVKGKLVWDALNTNDAVNEKTEPPPADTVVGGIINGKAIHLPKPKYPAEARLQQISGSVSVRVLVDVNGKVLTAKDRCGPSVFSEEAEAAAMKSQFSPTLLSGRAVKVSGFITYNFVNEK